ncbi:hypothetical protein [Escherichia coli]|uniref:hypothetical protein n=1 Tax=Escherichia coli TaxID=562 RepID=UPI0038FCFCA3
MNKTKGCLIANFATVPRTGREAGVLIIAELFSEVVTVSQPVPGEEETDITDGIRLSDWYYKYKKSSESNVKDLPE